MNNKIKMANSKGITLVALVVTIVVMLILAGVSINVSVGGNGLLTKAQDIKANIEQAENEGQEKIDSLKSNEYLEDGTITANDTTAPTINNLEVTKLSDTSLKVSVNVTETGSGLAKIEYSIDGGKKFFTPLYMTDKSYIFNNLDLSSTEYTAVVKVTDIKGNSSNASKKVEK